MAVKKKIPMRKCVGCGEMKPKKDLMRILKTETGEFLVDADGKKNRRGAYICRSVECFRKAVKSKGWSAHLNSRYRKRCTTDWKRRWTGVNKRDKALSLISLAMKAGRCASGEMMTRERG